MCFGWHIFCDVCFWVFLYSLILKFVFSLTFIVCLVFIYKLIFFISLISCTYSTLWLFLRCELLNVSISFIIKMLHNSFLSKDCLCHGRRNSKVDGGTWACQATGTLSFFFLSPAIIRYIFKTYKNWTSCSPQIVT